MADAAADLTNCPVCFESYTENGNNIPRVLPCFHTVCEGCLEQLINNRNSLSCPECRTDFQAKEGVKSFQQNKYVLAFIKRGEQTSTPRDEEPLSVEGRFSLCQEHPSKELSLYCKNQGCLRSICQLCLIKKHMGHTVVDIAEEHTQKLQIFYSKIETATKNLEINRANILATADEITQTNQACLADIMNAKTKTLENIAKAFDNMMVNANNQIATTTTQIQEDLSAIENNLSTLQTIEGNTNNENTLEDINEKIKSIDVIARQPPRNSYNSGTYVANKALIGGQGNTGGVCGQLKNRVHAVKARSQMVAPVRGGGPMNHRGETRILNAWGEIPRVLSTAAKTNLFDKVSTHQGNPFLTHGFQFRTITGDGTIEPLCLSSQGGSLQEALQAALSMPKGQLVQLDPSADEYREVATEFQKTCPRTIIQIEKIVNLDREGQYSAIKERQRNLTEGKFWFAPRGISKDLLREQGFNFDYLCRREAPIQYRARGIHFSADAHSAVHDSGAAADSPHGVENLAIYARVLTVANKQTCRRRVQRLQRLQRSHHSVNDVTIANGNLANPDYVVTFI